jgi:hypothetical protein
MDNWDKIILMADNLLFALATETKISKPEVEYTRRTAELYTAHYYFCEEADWAKIEKLHEETDAQNE